MKYQLLTVEFNTIFVSRWSLGQYSVIAATGDNMEKQQDCYGKTII